MRKVNDGSELVTRSGETLGQIVASIKAVSGLVAEIAAACREQSQGIEQINQSVLQMDEFTQTNGSLVAQATAASQTMAQRAGELNTMMQRYQLNDAAGRSPDQPPHRLANPGRPRRRRRRPAGVAGRMPRSVAAAPAPGPDPPRRARRWRRRPSAAQLRTAADDDTDWKEF